MGLGGRHPVLSVSGREPRIGAIMDESEEEERG